MFAFKNFKDMYNFPSSTRFLKTSKPPISGFYIAYLYMHKIDVSANSYGGEEALADASIKNEKKSTLYG